MPGFPRLVEFIAAQRAHLLDRLVSSDQRMEFTAIGDPVNVADRLQDMARLGEVLVGGETVTLVSDSFRFQDRGELAIRGRTATVRVGELASDEG